MKIRPLSYKEMTSALFELMSKTGVIAMTSAVVDFRGRAEQPSIQPRRWME